MVLFFDSILGFARYENFFQIVLISFCSESLQVFFREMVFILKLFLESCLTLIKSFCLSVRLMNLNAEDLKFCDTQSFTTAYLIMLALLCTELLLILLALFVSHNPPSFEEWL